MAQLSHSCVAVAALIVAGCKGTTGADVGNLLMPDQLHAFYADGSYDGSGEVGGIARPNRFDTAASGETQSWSLGLTWDLWLIGKTAQQREMEAAVRQMTIAANLMAARAQEPDNVSVDLGLFSEAFGAALATAFTGGGADGSESSPIHITIEGGDQTVTAQGGAEGDAEGDEGGERREEQDLPEGGSWVLLERVPLTAIVLTVLSALGVIGESLRRRRRRRSSEDLEAPEDPLDDESPDYDAS